jgi:hypothetical protein
MFNLATLVELGQVYPAAARGNPALLDLTQKELRFNKNGDSTRTAIQQEL